MHEYILCRGFQGLPHSIIIRILHMQNTHGRDMSSLRDVNHGPFVSQQLPRRCGRDILQSSSMRNFLSSVPEDTRCIGPLEATNSD